MMILASQLMMKFHPAVTFFGASHTMSRYQTAFYEPVLSDWTNYEAWQEAGAKNATHRATDIWQQMLASYEAPALAEDIKDELTDFVAKRKEQIGTNEI